jgi:hypothetical protein
MTYRPTETVFLPPWTLRLPALAYLLVAVVIGGIVFAADMSPTNSELYVWVIESNAKRIISPQTFAVLLLISAVASVLRTGMRGVRVRGDGVEYRDIVSLVVPKRRRYRWAQIDRVILDDPKIVALDLWDGSRAFLPPVSDRNALAATIEKVALARAIPVRGGSGLDDIPESGEYGPELT